MTIWELLAENIDRSIRQGKGRMGSLSREVASSSSPALLAAVLLLIVCFVPILAESRVVLSLRDQFPSHDEEMELQRRHGRELLGNRSSPKISNPAPRDNAHIHYKSPPPRPPPPPAPGDPQRQPQASLSSSPAGYI
ncbi:hypothetical protein H6P81_008773 [Aristolochia fimbriata]|uniref:Uncharacterized protein n=1 Tax=Aristolochia fimbriata TaxID=158543 RepID=A0AAV7EIZ7_ARIFI|nr:hypothetical protein H6P81_008773 [Aristolochia fimbriata]